MEYPYETRVGCGFDAHRFTGDTVDAHIMICGVAVPHGANVEAHSDGDVGLHALTDALLGAMALGDIGDHFPPTDARWKNADSGVFVRHARLLVEERGGTIVNADITLLAERPKIAPYREKMRATVADLLGLALDRVSVKATTTEKMGFLGRQEGLAAQAVVSIQKTVNLPS